MRGRGCGRRAPVTIHAQDRDSACNRQSWRLGLHVPSRYAEKRITIRSGAFVAATYLLELVVQYRGRYRWSRCACCSATNGHGTRSHHHVRRSPGSRLHQISQPASGIDRHCENAVRDASASASPARRGQGSTGSSQLRLLRPAVRRVVPARCSAHGDGLTDFGAAACSESCVSWPTDRRHQFLLGWRGEVDRRHVCVDSLSGRLQNAIGDGSRANDPG